MPFSRDPAGRRLVLKALLGLATGGATGVGAWGYLYERHRVRLVDYRVPVKTLPPVLDGLRVALLTDMHRSRSVPADLIRAAVTLTRASNPDLIVLGGDYVTWGDRRYVDDAAAALDGLTAPLGVFAVLGNHDDDRDMPAALTRHGFIVLRDARTTITIRGERTDLIGIRFWTRKTADLQRLLRGAEGFPILLAHDPRRVTGAQALRLPLVLSGHTHGGQVLLPGLTGLVSRKFPILSGVARRDRTTLVVSRGIGTVYLPLRINCPPEVSLLVLSRHDAPDDADGRSPVSSS
jgi:predicted MPP superfamily phosphohydrolase